MERFFCVLRTRRATKPREPARGFTASPILTVIGRSPHRGSCHLARCGSKPTVRESTVKLTLMWSALSHTLTPFRPSTFSYRGAANRHRKEQHHDPRDAHP